MKIIKLLSSIVLAATLVANATAQVLHEQGTLIREPTTYNYDFKLLTALNPPASVVRNGNSAKLQARYVWQPANPALNGLQINTPQHAVVAFTQSLNPNFMRNPSGQYYWSHGVGAFVGENGLQLELWFTEADGSSNAYVWSQNNNRCMAIVHGYYTPGQLCLDGHATPGGSYLTPAPNFKLRFGVPYWLRLEVRPASPGWMVLLADLIEDSCIGGVCGPRIVQQGSISVITNSWWPNQLYPINASIARTEGDVDAPFVNYDAFNGGW